MRRHPPLGRDQRGTSGVEFALLAPVMLLILAGMVDFGMTLWARLQLEQSLSTITNYAIVSADWPCSFRPIRISISRSTMAPPTGAPVAP